MAAILLASPMSDDALQETLIDLKHDLGKYLVLPLAMLPRDAAQADVRAALARALLQTRKDRAGTHTARSVWQRFEGELAPALSASPAYAALRAAVERALAWEPRLADEAALERTAIETDLRAVQHAIAALIAEVQDG
jgi:hypothetical protein